MNSHQVPQDFGVNRLAYMSVYDIVKSLDPLPQVYTFPTVVEDWKCILWIE